MRYRTTRELLGAALAFVIVAQVACALSPELARAHVPELEHDASGGPMMIGGPEASRAIYGYLAPDEQNDAYEFSVDEPVTRRIGVIVPVRDEHADFRPALRLYADGSEVALIEDSGSPEREAEWEPFSLTSFWHGTEEEFAFEPGIAYELHVEPGTGDMASGRYVLVFGGPEAFTAAETLRTFAYLPVIWFGAYGGAPAHWNWWALIPLGITIALVALVVRGLVRVLRRSLARGNT